MLRKIIIFLLVFFAGSVFFIKPIQAITFDLIPPDGELQRGQEIKFTINVDTEGKSYNNTKIGMTYDTQYLEYVSVSSGDTFSTVSAESAGEGKLIVTGSTNSSYSGSGIFAYVTFKLIAQSPGSTQLCVLFNPQNTPTIPPPTALPTTGSVNNVYKGVLVGLAFLIIAGSGLFFFKNI